MVKKVIEKYLCLPLPRIITCNQSGNRLSYSMCGLTHTGLIYVCKYKSYWIYQFILSRESERIFKSAHTQGD